MLRDIFFFFNCINLEKLIGKAAVLLFMYLLHDFVPPLCNGSILQYCMYRSHLKDYSFVILGEVFSDSSIIIVLAGEMQSHLFALDLFYVEMPDKFCNVW